MIDRNELIEVVTRQVLATLAGQHTDQGLENAPQVVASGAARLGYCGAGADVPKDLAEYIDHTLLRPDASPADIDQLCDEAVELHQPVLGRASQEALARVQHHGGLGGRFPARRQHPRDQGDGGAPRLARRCP